MKRESSAAISSRRTWIRSGGAGLAVLLANPRLLAQNPPTGDVLHSMSRLTGTTFEERWPEPVTALVNVILEDSKPLRSLDLREIEPATIFSAL